MPSLVCVLVGTLGLFAGDFDGALGGRVEFRGGQAPTVPGQRARPSVALLLLPLAGMQYTTYRHQMRAEYQPRLFWRFPNVLNLRRPLHLHRVSLGHSHDLTRRLEWTGSARLSIGELDYTSANLVLGGVQSSVPDQEILPYVDTGIEEGLRVDLTRRHWLSTSVGASFSGPLEESDFARILRGSATPEYGFLVTRRDELRVGVRGELVEALSLFRLLAWTPYAGWSHRFTRWTTGSVRGGLFVAHVVRAEEDVDIPPVIPDVAASIDSTFVRRARVSVAGRFTAGIEPFVDVIQGTVRPRVYARGGLQAAFGLDWTAAVEATFSTPGTREPQIAEDSDFAPDLTLLTVRTPVRRRLTDDVAVELGTWMTARAPHLSRGGFEADRLEIWGYVAITGAWAVDGGGLTWAP